MKHIVMWRLKNPVTAKTDAHQIKLTLDALPGLIPQIVHFEVGINQAQDQAACDLVLISEFKSRDELIAYQQHAAHREAVKLIRSLAQERFVVDYDNE